MSIEQADADRATVTVLKQFVRAYNTGDIDVFMSLCGERYAWHGFADGRPVDLDLAGFRASIVDFWASFPDANLKVLDTISQGDRVSTRLRETGHHTGRPWLGFAPDGARVIWYPSIIYRIKNGKVVEEWSAPITYDREAARQNGRAP